MWTDRKLAAEARARFFPKPSTKLDENILRVNAKLAREGSVDPVMDMVPGFENIPESKPELAKKVKHEKKTCGGEIEWRI